MATTTLSWVTSSWFGHQSFHCLLVTFADSETCFYWYVKDFEEFSTTLCVHAKSLQSCPTLYDPMDCSPPGSSIHGILQARILEWVAICLSKVLCKLTSWICKNGLSSPWEPDRPKIEVQGNGCVPALGKGALLTS